MPLEPLALSAMGTRFEIVLSGDSSRDLRAAGEEALATIAELHRLWSVFDPGSQLSRVNRLAAREAVAVDGETLALLHFAREVWRASGGAFDPTLGARMREAGFRGAPPDRADAREGARRSPGFAAVELDARAGTVRFLDPAIELDLGAIAKGWALDRAAEELRAAGVAGAFLHGGTSSALAIGAPPGERGWIVALERVAVRTLLRDDALGVSGAGGRIAPGAPGADPPEPRGHILDPATGLSAATDRWSAVVAPSAALADAWSTALVAVDRTTPSTALVAADRTTPSTALVAADRTTPSTALVAVDRTTPSTALVAVDPTTPSTALVATPPTAQVAESGDPSVRNRTISLSSRRSAPPPELASPAALLDPPPDLTWLASGPGGALHGRDPRGALLR